MRGQHYPGNTLSVSKWCRECQANTQHRVDSHKVSRVCIPCQEKAEAEHQARLANPEPPQAKQEALFA
jgi:hypothetical protein